GRSGVGPGQDSGRGAHAEKTGGPAGGALGRRARRELLALATGPQVVIGEDADLGDVPRGNVANRCPELGDSLARKPVVHPPALSARPGEAAPGKQPKMM